MKKLFIIAAMFVITASNLMSQAVSIYIEPQNLTLKKIDDSSFEIEWGPETKGLDDIKDIDVEIWVNNEYLQNLRFQSYKAKQKYNVSEWRFKARKSSLTIDKVENQLYKKGETLILAEEANLHLFKGPVKKDFNIWRIYLKN